MPSKSAKQHRLMEAAAHNATFARKVGIKQSVANEFVAADAAAGITEAHGGGAKPKGRRRNPAK